MTVGPHMCVVGYSVLETAPCVDKERQEGKVGHKVAHERKFGTDFCLFLIKRFVFMEKSRKEALCQVFLCVKSTTYLVHMDDKGLCGHMFGKYRLREAVQVCLGAFECGVRVELVSLEQTFSRCVRHGVTRMRYLCFCVRGLVGLCACEGCFQKNVYGFRQKVF